MPHTIKLTEAHIVVVLTALSRSLDNKLSTVIKDEAKKPLTIKQYEDAGEKLFNPIVCGKKSNNLFTWIADQLLHSPQVVHTEDVQRALLVCKYAALNEYDKFTQTQDNFLFD